MYKTIMDNGDYYEMQESYTHINDRYSSLTQQIRMHTAGADDIPFWKKTGLKSTKKDQLFLFMNNLSTVEWGNKDWKTCLEKMVVGVRPKLILQIFRTVVEHKFGLLFENLKTRKKIKEQLFMDCK
jgi:hypothetical protein